MLRLFVRGVCYTYIDSIVERRSKGRKERRKGVESREVCSSTKETSEIATLVFILLGFTIIG